MITALTTLIIIVQKRVRQSRFSPPWGGYCTFGIFAAIINTGQYDWKCSLSNYRNNDVSYLCRVFLDSTNFCFIQQNFYLIEMYLFVTISICVLLYITYWFHVLFMYKCTKLYMYDSAGHGQKLMIERKIFVQYLLSIIETLVSYCFL